jgi:hypothetical protein
MRVFLMTLSLTLLFFSCNSVELQDRDDWLIKNVEPEPPVTEQPIPLCVTNPEHPDCTPSGVGHVSSELTQVVGSSKVDIIWVVDNSGSMLPYQAALALNFESFIDSFLQTGNDFKMGITTTDADPNDYQAVDGYPKDPGACGKFVVNPLTPIFPKVLTSVMEENMLKTFFAANINVGTSGAYNETGLEAARLALENNPGFLREDAYLAIIIVSDENDVSPQTTQFYADLYKSYKPNNPDSVMVYSIIDTTDYPDDAYDPVSETFPGGKRYKEISDATNAFYVDISENFSDTLIEIGTSIVGLINKFELNKVPAPGTLKLFMNNKQVPENDIDGYTYDAAENTISFHGTYMPGPKTKVKLSYDVNFSK